MSFALQIKAVNGLADLIPLPIRRQSFNRIMMLLLGKPRHMGFILVLQAHPKLFLRFVKP
ncbi:hypothetical protein D3C76_1345620 [compost metagenome]